ncbi:uncharacterized protein LOC121246424 [Juglans microcarpa x Juglans regia]|uniref:uncharacterized protein LOC121246424 n=1 Tax=Juglans microcarpa x Juglans regia TaxID=2249226 RepID=UPI001B7DBFE5|nr:uncharacterized protein LOC121246424 [Juglans microcarpa x Juglans regia]
MEIRPGTAAAGRSVRLNPVVDDTEGGDKDLRRSYLYMNVVPVEISEISLLRNRELITEEEVNLWNSVVEEASRMQAEMSGEALDHKTKQHLVSPMTVELEPDDYEDYFRTDLFYQLGLSREPNNTLLLSNYAQFLHLVSHDNDRAEECFNRVLLVDPMDAEGLCRYADFSVDGKKGPVGSRR